MRCEDTIGSRNVLRSSLARGRGGLMTGSRLVLWVWRHLSIGEKSVDASSELLQIGKSLADERSRAL